MACNFALVSLLSHNLYSNRTLFILFREAKQTTNSFVSSEFKNNNKKKDFMSLMKYRVKKMLHKQNIIYSRWKEDSRKECYSETRQRHILGATRQSLKRPRARRSLSPHQLTLSFLRRAKLSAADCFKRDDLCRPVLCLFIISGGGELITTDYVSFKKSDDLSCLLATVLRLKCHTG